MTCRAHWLQLWRRPHKWRPLTRWVVEGHVHDTHTLRCQRCKQTRQTVDSRTH